MGVSSSDDTHAFAEEIFRKVDRKSSVSNLYRQQEEEAAKLDRKQRSYKLLEADDDDFNDGRGGSVSVAPPKTKKTDKKVKSFRKKRENQEDEDDDGAGILGQDRLVKRKVYHDKSEDYENSGVGGKVRQRKSTGCPMLRKHKLQNDMIDQGPLDIGDLVRLGCNLGTCPYYGSRSMVLATDLVVLPYQSLLSKSSRESLGLSLKNCVVIIDEAHNLADSLISMYDSKITLSQVNFEGTSKIKELTEVHGAWLPPWLAGLLVGFQSYVESYWEEHGRPAFELLKQKILVLDLPSNVFQQGHVFVSDICHSVHPLDIKSRQHSTSTVPKSILQSQHIRSLNKMNSGICSEDSIMKKCYDDFRNQMVDTLIPKWLFGPKVTAS